MIRSMTGYGTAASQHKGVTYAVEMRTVNNRYFKSSVKLPESIAYLEADVERLLQKHFFRGTVGCVLRLKDVSANTLFDIDEKALRAYLGRLSRIASSSGVNCEIDICGLLALPGIIQPLTPGEETAGEIRRVVLAVTQKAVDQVKVMRSAEGAALLADLQGHCNAITQGLDKIRRRNAEVVQEYQKKLRERVNMLLAKAKLKLDEATLAREVAIYAERSDISEEVARLDSHLEQLRQSCQSDSQAGRKLDFISQEMLREVNTIASKACDVEISRDVVEMKCEIDRIKEQAQNIE